MLGSDGYCCLFTHLCLNAFIFLFGGKCFCRFAAIRWVAIYHSIMSVVDRQLTDNTANGIVCIL